MATAKFLSKDQNWASESTTYWFQLDGADYGTSREFAGEVFGICESGPTDSVLDAEGAPLTEGDGITIAVRRACTVTDEHRSA